MRNQLIYLILVLAISGCISPRKLAKKCAEEYPCEIDTIELVRMERDSFIIPWHTVEFIDTTECPPGRYSQYCDQGKWSKRSLHE
jgi:hypothetical protein